MKRSEMHLFLIVSYLFRMRVGGAAPRQSRLLQCSVLEGGREEWEDRLEEAASLVARCLQGDKSQNEVRPELSCKQTRCSHESIAPTATVKSQTLPLLTPPLCIVGWFAMIQRQNEIIIGTTEEEVIKN